MRHDLRETWATRRAWLAVALSGSLASLGFRWHTTRPGCRTSIPNRDYQFGSRSSHARSLSRVGLLLPKIVPATGEISPEKLSDPIRLFQLEEPRLTIGHCSLSEVALLIESKGHWSLSLRADQNPREGLPRDELQAVSGRRPAEPDGSHILRNLFHLEVRGYAQRSIPETDASRDIGRPVVFVLKPEPFWVQRGEPHPLRETGCDSDIHKYFAYIDRIELEFYFE